MLTLYTKPGCPFCAAVLHKIDELGIDVQEKSVANEGVSDELMEKGGKHQVPFLVDTDCDVMMYESKDINEHLEEHHSGDNGNNDNGNGDNDDDNGSDDSNAM